MSQKQQDPVECLEGNNESVVPTPSASCLPAISANVRSSCYPGRVYWVSACMGLNDGGFYDFVCDRCDAWAASEDDDDGDWMPCRHVGAAALAFLLDPGSFAGCPAGLACL